MRQHFHNGLSWYTFDLLAEHPELRHGAFTRHGGVSGPRKDELHTAFNGWAPVEETRQNLKRAENALGLPPAALVGQCHTNEVTVVRFEDHYHPAGPEELRPQCDALVASESGVNLLITVGDCQAVILYDPGSGILGLVHSGWQGSVKNILGATVDKMVHLGATPAQILVGISPSLGPCCAEFDNYREELPESFQEFMVKENYFDFWAISRRQLTERGVDPKLVEVAGICTKCSPDFFSHRRGEAGRFGVMAGIIKENI